jgi:hypothetical protein
MRTLTETDLTGITTGAAIGYIQSSGIDFWNDHMRASRKQTRSDSNSRWRKRSVTPHMTVRTKEVRRGH